MYWDCKPADAVGAVGAAQAKAGLGVAGSEQSYSAERCCTTEPACGIVASRLVASPGAERIVREGRETTAHAEVQRSNSRDWKTPVLENVDAFEAAPFGGCCPPKDQVYPPGCTILAVCLRKQDPGHPERDIAGLDRRSRGCRRSWKTNGGHAGNWQQGLTSSSAFRSPDPAWAETRIGCDHTGHSDLKN